MPYPTDAQRDDAVVYFLVGLVRDGKPTVDIRRMVGSFGGRIALLRFQTTRKMLEFETFYNFMTPQMSMRMKKGKWLAKKAHGDKRRKR